MKNQRLKDDILADLNALAETGIRKTAKLVDRVRAGEFDSDIDELEAIRVSEATDLIIELSEIS